MQSVSLTIILTTKDTYHVKGEHAKRFLQQWREAQHIIEIKDVDGYHILLNADHIVKVYSEDKTSTSSIVPF